MNFILANWMSNTTIPALIGTMARSPRMGLSLPCESPKRQREPQSSSRRLAGISFGSAIFGVVMRFGAPAATAPSAEHPASRLRRDDQHTTVGGCRWHAGRGNPHRGPDQGLPRYRFGGSGQTQPRCPGPGRSSACSGRTARGRRRPSGCWRRASFRRRDGCFSPA